MEQVEQKFFGSLFYEYHKRANICILKFPYDSGKKNDLFICGEGKDLGPDCVYRFIPRIGVVENPMYSQEGRL